MILISTPLVQETYQISRGDDLVIGEAGCGAAKASIGSTNRFGRFQGNNIGGDVESPRKISDGHLSKIF